MGAEVTVVEAQDRILPLYDKALTDPVRKWLEKHGVVLHLGAKAKGLQGEALAVETRDGRDHRTPGGSHHGHRRSPSADQGWGLENMGLEMAGPFVKVDDQCRTSMRGVFAWATWWASPCWRTSRRPRARSSPRSSPARRAASIR
jgi:dihydrolipoamide dehydrogenase